MITSIYIEMEEGSRGNIIEKNNTELCMIKSTIALLLALYFFYLAVKFWTLSDQGYNEYRSGLNGVKGALFGDNPSIKDKYANTGIAINKDGKIRLTRSYKQSHTMSLFSE